MAAAKTISCRVLSQCPKAGPWAGPQLLRISTTHALVTATVPTALPCPGTSTPEPARVRLCSCIVVSPINRSLKIKCKKKSKKKSQFIINSTADAQSAQELGSLQIVPFSGRSPSTTQKDAVWGYQRASGAAAPCPRPRRSPLPIAKLAMPSSA